jgi:hypothetical protein
LASVCQKLVLDIEYIEGAGFLLDARIILCTGLRILKLPVIGFFGLQRNVPVIQLDGNSPSGGNGSSGGKESPGGALRETVADRSVPDITVSGDGKKDGHAAGSEAGKKPKPR